MSAVISCNFNKIFVGGLSPFTKKETLRDYFARFGELADCVIMQDKNTGKFRGFGFVTFRDATVINAILAKTHVIDGKTVDCKVAFPRDQLAKTETPKKIDSEGFGKIRKIFVGGLPHTITEDKFNKYFARFGTIESSSIMYDKTTGKPRGFGFVVYTSEEAAERVIQNYEKNFIDEKWVECKIAVPKSKMSSTNTSVNSQFDAFSPTMDSISPERQNTTGSFNSFDSGMNISDVFPESQPQFVYRTVINPQTFQEERIIQVANFKSVSDSLPVTNSTLRRPFNSCEEPFIKPFSPSEQMSFGPYSIQETKSAVPLRRYSNDAMPQQKTNYPKSKYKLSFDSCPEENDILSELLSQRFPMNEMATRKQSASPSLFDRVPTSQYQNFSLGYPSPMQFGQETQGFNEMNGSCFGNRTPQYEKLPFVNSGDDSDDY